MLPEDLEEEVRGAAEISMGTEVSENDKDNVLQLCDQVKGVTVWSSSCVEES